MRTITSTAFQQSGLTPVVGQEPFFYFSSELGALIGRYRAQSYILFRAFGALIFGLKGLSGISQMLKMQEILSRSVPSLAILAFKDWSWFLNPLILQFSVVRKADWVLSVPVLFATSYSKNEQPLSSSFFLRSAFRALNYCKYLSRPYLAPRCLPSW